MAGLWERVVGSNDPNAPERLNISLLRTELTLFALDNTIRTRQQAFGNLEADSGIIFDAAELVDLNAIADRFAQGATQSKLAYFHQFEAANNAAELQLISESDWRTIIEIA